MRHHERHEAAPKIPRSGLRILHVAEPLLGGVITHLKEAVAGHAATPGIDSIGVITPDHTAATLRSVTASGVQIHTVRYRRGSVISLLRLAVATLRHVRRDAPDIVHIHSTIAGLVVRLSLILLIRRPAIVYCPHGWAFGRTWSRRSSDRFLGWTERLLSYVTDAIICVSDEEKRIAVSIGIAPSRCVVVKNGMPDLAVQMPPPLGNHRLCLLYVGRLDKQKGFDIYIQALDRLGDLAEGIVVGDYFVDKPQATRIPSNVKLVGWRSHEELLPFYQQADAVIIPSRSEGLPLVAIEAMRASRPIFGSCIAGLQETVVDGKTGRLFPPNDVDALVDHIRSTPRETLGAYGAAGRDRFQNHFTVERMNRELLAVYWSATANTSAKRYRLWRTPREPVLARAAQPKHM
jgi:glycosyltransferase involved in cell wall biosynthesis